MGKGPYQVVFHRYQKTYGIGIGIKSQNRYWYLDIGMIQYQGIGIRI